MNKEEINEVFEAFNKGCLIVPEKTINFEQVEWSKHPTFEGVELKHIIKGEQTDEKFSYHLVSAGDERLYLFAKFMPALC